MQSEHQLSTDETSRRTSNRAEKLRNGLSRVRTKSWRVRTTCSSNLGRVHVFCGPEHQPSMYCQSRTFCLGGLGFTSPPAGSAPHFWKLGSQAWIHSSNARPAELLIQLMSAHREPRKPPRPLQAGNPAVSSRQSLSRGFIRLCQGQGLSLSYVSSFHLHA